MSEKFNYLDSTDEKKRLSEKHKNFIKLGIILVIALSAGGKTLYNNHIQRQDAEIAQKEEMVKSTPLARIKEAMQKEKAFAQQVNAENLVLVSKYTKYPDLIKILKYNNNLAGHMKNNTVFLQNTNNSIAADEGKIDRIQKAISRDDKVEVYLNGNNFEAYNKWVQSIKTGDYVYANQLVNLNTTIEGEIKILENTQQEIMKTVKERIKAKDFSLDAAQASFAADLRKEKDKEINELASLKKELEGTEESNSFTAADMQSVTGDLNHLEDETMAQIKQDREKLDKLLAENGAATTLASNGAAANTVAHQQTTSNFPTYLLMYHWMMSGSNYNAGYNAGVNSAVASSFRNSAPYSMSSMQNSGASSAAAVNAARIRNNVANATQRARASVARANSARVAKANAARSTNVSSSGFGRSGGMSSGS